MANDFYAQSLALAALGNSGGGSGDTGEPFECAGETWSNITDAIGAKRELQYTISVPAINGLAVATIVMRHPVIIGMGGTVASVMFCAISDDGNDRPAVFKALINSSGASNYIAAFTDYTFQPFGS